MTDRAEFTRLVLQVERDSEAQKHLNRLLSAAASTVARHRRELRNLKERMARRSTRSKRGT